MTPRPTKYHILEFATELLGIILFVNANCLAAVAAPNLTGVSPVVTGNGTGTSTTSWNPTISVVVPANFAAGVYTSTITHSVA